MRKNIVFGISIILLLLPMVMPTTIITSPRASIEPSQPVENSLDEVLAGTRLAYNITGFDYGDGIFDMLDMFLSAENIPVFDKGIIGTLEGSDLYFYIAAMRDLYLYQFDYMDEVFENETLQPALQAIPILELEEDFGIYADLSTFSFPEDIVRQNLDYYFASWPQSDFTFDISGTEFWDNAHNSFTAAFSSGWNDAEFGDPWHWMDWLDTDKYNNDMYWFAEEFGDWQGYWTGADAYWTSGGNVAWNNPVTAYEGYIEGFLTGRDGGFNAAHDDWMLDKIPDIRYVNLYDSSVALYDLGEFRGYEMSYGMYYESGYLYDGAQIYLNERLYHDLYNDQYETWMSGYINGYDWQYWEGRSDGDYDNSYSNAYRTSYTAPEIYDDHNEWDAGHNAGMLEGYDDGYDDGFYALNTNELRLQGMRDYEYDAYFEGFEIGADDELTSTSYDDTPDSMPFPISTSDPYEQGANYAYENSYVSGYDNGYKFAFLISNSNDLFWKTSAGPFYHMTFPYIELAFLAGSILPIPLPMTMFTDLGFESTEYEYWYDNPHGGDYDPFEDFMLPFTLYAPDTNWVELDDVDHIYNASEPDVPGIITTYDEIAGTFIYDFYMNMSGEGEIEYTLGYNTTSSLLESFDLFLNFTMMPDVWLDVSLNIDESKTEYYSPALPSPTTWVYSLEEFTFYFETPPGMDTEGLAEWKDMMLNSIDDPFISVTALGYDGLWAEQSITIYDLEGVEAPNTTERMYPMMFPMGFQILPDWDTIDGMWSTVTSVFDNADILTTVMSALDAQNANVDISNLVIQPETGTYLYNGEVQYYYVTFSGEVDGQISMLNGDYEWETDTLTGGTADATLWVAFETSTGVLVGAGVRAGLDATLTQVPDYGNSGSLSVYIEMKQGVDFMTIPDIYDLGLVDLPAVPEFGIVSILGIIALAGIASAIIISKKR